LITREDIERAFSEEVPYRLSPWGNETALRKPSAAEVKARLLKLVNAKGGAE
jgi:hypothetical protein